MSVCVSVPVRGGQFWSRARALLRALESAMVEDAEETSVLLARNRPSSSSAGGGGASSSSSSGLRAADDDDHLAASGTPRGGGGAPSGAFDSLGFSSIASLFGRALSSSAADDAVAANEPSPKQQKKEDGGALLSRNASLKRTASGTSKQRVCLICLEPLSEDDFASGEAIVLQCDCKGDTALRHRACAIKWAQVKGSTTCDICKRTIANLPSDLESLPPPELIEPLTPPGEESFPGGLHGDSHVPPALDLSFDFLRITWIATIVCVLLIQLDLQESLWIGSIVGLSYILLMKAFNCCGRRAMAAEVERERERAAAAAAAASSESPSYDVIPITSPRPGARSHTPTLWNVV